MFIDLPVKGDILLLDEYTLADFQALVVKFF